MLPREYELEVQGHLGSCLRVSQIIELPGLYNTIMKFAQVFCVLYECQYNL